jgi:hypothetical protein
VFPFVDSLWQSSKNYPTSRSDELWYLFTLFRGGFEKGHFLHIGCRRSCGVPPTPASPEAIQERALGLWRGSLPGTPVNKGKKTEGRERSVLDLPSVAGVPHKGSSHNHVGPDVLVEAEEVVGVILPRTVGLADPLLTLLHQEVYIDARVVRLEG